jgi:hypothetical protein
MKAKNNKSVILKTSLLQSDEQKKRYEEVV